MFKKLICRLRGHRFTVSGLFQGEILWWRKYKCERCGQTGRCWKFVRFPLSGCEDGVNTFFEVR